jgi:hypothetical protein
VEKSNRYTFRSTFITNIGSPRTSTLRKSALVSVSSYQLPSITMYLLPCHTGDSLSQFFGPPRLFLADLKKWVEKLFSGPFTYDCARFPHGAQQDSYNCGIFTINAIGHGVFGDPILMAAEANKERLRWFALFAKTAVPGGVNQPVRPDLANLLNPSDDCFTTDITAYEEAFELVEEATDILSDTPESDADIILDDSDPPTIPPSTTHSLSSAPEDAGSVESEPEIPHRKDSDVVKPKLKRTFHLSSDSEADADMILDTPTIPPSTTHSSAFEDAGSVESEPEIPHQQDMPVGKDSGLDAVKPKLTRKRTIHLSSDSDKYETDNDYRRQMPVKKRGKGKSRSAISSLRVREALRKGTFEVDDKRLEAWKEQISRDDHGATFDPSNIRRVRHSICGGWIIVKQPFDRTRWKTHLKNCTTKKKIRHEKPSAHMATLKSMGFFVPKNEAATKQDPPNVKAIEYPCPGLSDADDVRISKYLSRTQVVRAGSVSLQKIVEETHGTGVRYVDLEEAERKWVEDEHEHRQTWRNVHERRKVYAINCQKVVSKPHDGKRALPCTECVAVFRSKIFKNALQRDAPNEKNAIYVPKKFRNSQIAQIYARCRGLQGIVEKAVSHHHIGHN